MPFTCLHNSDHTPIEEKLSRLGSEMKANQYGRKPGTKKEVMALKELQQMSAVEKKRLDSSVEKGLKELASRFKQNPDIPDVPQQVWDKYLSDGKNSENADQDLEFWHDKYPFLDLETAKALDDKSDDYDLNSKCIMFAFGAHFVSQAWTDKELLGWFGTKDAEKYKPEEMTAKERADCYAKLTFDVIWYSSGCVGVHSLEHMAGRLKVLSMEDLEEEVENAGIKTTDHIKKESHKGALIVALVEYMYGDVLEPADSA